MGSIPTPGSPSHRSRSPVQFWRESGTAPPKGPTRSRRPRIGREHGAVRPRGGPRRGARLLHPQRRHQRRRRPHDRADRGRGDHDDPRRDDPRRDHAHDASLHGVQDPDRERLQGGRQRGTAHHRAAGARLHRAAGAELQRDHAQAELDRRLLPPGFGGGRRSRRIRAGRRRDGGDADADPHRDRRSRRGDDPHPPRHRPRRQAAACSCTCCAGGDRRH